MPRTNLARFRLSVVQSATLTFKVSDAHLHTSRLQSLARSTSRNNFLKAKSITKNLSNWASSQEGGLGKCCAFHNHIKITPKLQNIDH